MMYWQTVNAQRNDNVAMLTHAPLNTNYSNTIDGSSLVGSNTGIMTNTSATINYYGEKLN